MKEILQKADALLRTISELKYEFMILNARAEQAVQRALNFYADDLARLKERIRENEKQLMALEKKNKKILFGEKDRIDMVHGALLYNVEKRVKRVKKMLAKLKDQGLMEAIKTIESVNWDEIEKWNDEKLAQVGTSREEKENFEYELINKKII